MKEKGPTLQEHLKAIAAAGGNARAEKLSEKKRKAIAQKGGKAGGAARAAALTPAKRKAIARKAAAAMWAKRKAESEGKGKD